MRGAIFEDAQNYKVVELPLEECGDDDVIVKNLYAGICGSDIETYWNGGASRGIKKGDELGHEVVSEVVQVGKNVKDIELGDHVWPQYGMAKRDMARSRTVGAFSEYIHMPGFQLGYSALKIDSEIPLKTAAMFEPFTIGAKGVVSANPGPGKTAVVFGAGIIGMSAGIMLKWYGCDQVMIVDVSASRLENAKMFGMTTCNLLEENLTETLMGKFGNMQTRFGARCGCDIYVDCIGTAKGDDPFFTINTYEKIGKRDSVFCIVGVHHEPVPINMGTLCLNNQKICGCGGTSPGVLAKDILPMMKSGQFPLEILVTHEYPLERIDEAMRMASNSHEAQKVLLRV